MLKCKAWSAPRQIKKWVAGFCLVVLATGISANNYSVGDEVREAVKKGYAVSYDKLEKAVAGLLNARILRVDLDEDDGIWLYELRLIAKDGRIIELEMNARTLEVLQVEGKALETIIRFP